MDKLLFAKNVINRTLKMAIDRAFLYIKKQKTFVVVGIKSITTWQQNNK